MKFLVVFAAVILAANALSIGDHWASFKQTHKKVYKNALEERQRLGVFQQNLKKIEEHNQKHAAGLVSYKMGINQFADMTKEEFVTMLNLNKASKPKRRLGNKVYKAPKKVAAAEVDWRTLGAVTPVKDQGQCGSCWSFSATGSMESQNFLKTGQLISLSEQQLVDCSTGYGNMGCDGGLMDSAFEYVQDNGITTENQYPYMAVDGRCESNIQTVLTIQGYTDIQSYSESDLQSAVENVGPISVAIDASNLQLYESGVFDDDECSQDQLNHGVLAVGYGTEDNVEYWLVKNSWGTAWGLNGYVQMSRNANNQCGISTMASYPNL